MKKHCVLKRVFLVATIISIVFLMTSCGNIEVTDYNMNENKVAAEILENVKFDTELYQVKDKKISNFIESDDCSMRLLFMGNGTAADSFGIFTSKNEESSSVTFETLKTYLSELEASYKAYLPVEAAKVEKAYSAMYGQYVVFCITADYEKAQQTVEGMLEQTTYTVKKKDYVPYEEPDDKYAPPVEQAKTDDILKPEYPKIPTPLDDTYKDAYSVVQIGNAGYETYTYVEQTAQNYADAMNNISSKLGSKVNLYDLLIPLGSGIILPDEYFDKITSSNQRAALNRIIEKLGDGIKVVDPYENLMMHRNEYIYYRTDHHWTQLGAYYAYEELCEKMGVLPISLNRHDTGKFSGFLGTFYNDLGKPSALKDAADDLDVFYPISKNAKLTYYTTNGASYEWKIINDVSTYPASVKYSAFIAGDNPYTYIENPDLNDGSVAVVVKESFGNTFVPFLVDHYQKIHVIDYRYWDGDLENFVSENKVDDVIFLNNLSMTRNSYLVGRIAQLVD